MDQEVLRSLTPGQQVVASSATRCWRCSAMRRAGCRRREQRPRVVLMLGLQGSGKTTTPASWREWLTRQGRHPLLVSTDVRRPAAIEQLTVVGKQAGVAGARTGRRDGPGRARARGALTEARNSGFDTVIVDTAGRLHIDDDLMGELAGDQGARSSRPTCSTSPMR